MYYEKMNAKDKRIMQTWAETIYGCNAEDLSDKEEKMLVYHIMERNSNFLAHSGVELD